jgi:hypothetical protein
MDKNFKNQEKRIEAVFQDKTEDLSKRMETIIIYKEYLDQNLSYPIELTGIEDFSWEEYYLLGPGSQKEYEKLKKSNPSYLDTFILEKISEQYDDYDGLIVNVIRVTDNKQFQIPLSELKSTNKRSKNYKLLDDYSVWIVNF